MILGSAAIIVENSKILMVRQGASDEALKWTVPSGRKNSNESFEECCIRETFEESGLVVKVLHEYMSKETDSYKIIYYVCEHISGEMQINDPDHLIHDVKWFTQDEVQELELSFDEDKKIIRNVLMPL